MAQSTVKLSVNDSAFPLLSRDAGRSVLIPNLDTQATASANPFSMVAKPHLVYCENVLPKGYGLTSVGYMRIAADAASGVAQNAYSMQVRNMGLSPQLQEPAVLVFFQNSAVVKYVTTSLSGTVNMASTKGQFVSVANAGGIQFVLDSHIGATTAMYEARINSAQTAVELTALYNGTSAPPIGMSIADFAQVAYCCGAGNYLILAKQDGTIFWSAPTFVNYVEFTVTAGYKWLFSVGRQVTGNTSGATGLLTALDIDGIGMGISGAVGTFAAGETLSAMGLEITTGGITGSFIAGEVLRGQTSGFAGQFCKLTGAVISIGGDVSGVPLDGEVIYGETSRAYGVIGVAGAALVTITSQAALSVHANTPAFSPSLTTGAGFSLPSAMNGVCIGLQTFGNGFIIHTTSGDIVAAYSNNALSPWIFTPVWNSEPVAINPITTMPSSTASATRLQQITWTSSGLMEYSAGGASANGIFPEVSDFLAGRFIETISPAGITGVPVAQDIALQSYILPATATADAMQVMVSYVGNRYLCISYGVYNYNAGGAYGKFTQCLVYDISLKRWGKLAYDHIGVVELPTNMGVGTSPTTKLPLAKTLSNIGLVNQLGGIISVVDYATNTTSYNGGTQQTIEHAGVLIFGGVSFLRNNVTIVDNVKATYGQKPTASTANTEAVTLAWAKSDDNVNYELFAQVPAQAAGVGAGSWNMRVVGNYLAFKMSGYFHVSEFEISLFRGGHR